jgi:nucleoside triphosphate diphosphatase
MPDQSNLSELLAIMARLRDPAHGCPWDLKQTFESIIPHTLEEAYEVADAVARGDLCDLKDELGDLLLQVVFHAQIAKEQSAFNFSDVVDSITNKLVRRHPHVFGDADGHTVEAVNELWAQIKAKEKLSKGKPSGGILAEVPAGIPALSRALKLQGEASQVGFDWNDPKEVLAKIREEIKEIETALEAGDQKSAAEEVGDLLFAVVNLSRHFASDPETVLRSTNLKFERRFASMERALAAEGKTPAEVTLAELEALWNRAKAEEKAVNG